jgi:integrase
MGTIRFVLRTDKPDKRGFCPVQLVYQLSGQRKYFKTRHRLYLINWEISSQSAVYVDKKAAKSYNEQHRDAVQIDFNLLPIAKDIKNVNNALAALRKEISDIEDRFELNRVQYSADMVIDSLKEAKAPLTKKAAPTNELFDFIEKYIIDHAGTRERGSLAVYKSLKTHLYNYQQQTRNKVAFDKIDYSFFQSFQAYLLSLKVKTADGKIAPRLNNTTIAKQLSTIKTFLNYARIQGVKVSDKYRDFKIKKESLEVIALTNEEFEKLFTMDLAGNRKLAHTRDIFCFSCSTGLRYSDLAQLKREHIKNDELRIVVKKTKEPLTIPLNPYSLSILDRYKDQHRPLPMISSQKLNENIKELCKRAEINDQVEIVRFRGAKREAITYAKYRLISVHTGRKTFATLSLEKGMSAEEVMTITGHKDYRSFSRYVKITEQRKKVVMRNAWGEIKMPQMKVV